MREGFLFLSSFGSQKKPFRVFSELEDADFLAAAFRAVFRQFGNVTVEGSGAQKVSFFRTPGALREDRERVRLVWLVGWLRPASPASRRRQLDLKFRRF